LEIKIFIFNPAGFIEQIFLSEKCEKKKLKKSENNLKGSWYDPTYTKGKNSKTHQNFHFEIRISLQFWG